MRDLLRFGVAGTTRDPASAIRSGSLPPSAPIEEVRPLRHLPPERGRQSPRAPVLGDTGAPERPDSFPAISAGASLTQPITSFVVRSQLPERRVDAGDP